MNSIEQLSRLVSPDVPRAAPQTRAPPPRVVQPVGEPDAASTERFNSFPSEKAVLELLRRSAAQFSAVLELTGDPAAAQAMSGINAGPAPPRHVDVYG